MRMKRFDARQVWQSAERCTLGECPLWDARTRSLHWIDVARPALLSLRTGDSGEHRHALDRPPASIFLSEGGRLLVVQRKANGWFVPGRVTLEPWAPDWAPPSEDERFNDGRCHPDGTVWISTMDRQLAHPVGSLVALRKDAVQAAREPVATHAIVGNGVCFSPDGKLLYFSDTKNRLIARYDIHDGALSGRRVLVALDADPGRPDGCCVDAEGFLWSARVAGGRIDRYAPDGRLDGYLPLPVAHPTHCTFGGDDGRILFVTSKPTDDAEDPLGGYTLAFDLGAHGPQGLPEARVAD